MLTALVAVPALVVVAGASSVITLLVTGRSHQPPTVAASEPHTATVRHATTGTLTAEDGSTWSVRLANGKTFAVKVGSGTTFGTKAHPSKADAFHTGAEVRVLGPVDGTTVNATRIVQVSGRAG